jgi:GNAT superfamily N-acetyltransferase
MYERDGFGAKFETLVAETADSRIIGFVSWFPSYDLHHCVSRGEGTDMYVDPARRGRAVALALIAGMAAEVQKRGGCYLRGQAVENPNVQQLYGRMVVLFAAECNVSGRAFRTLAELRRRQALLGTQVDHPFPTS